MSQPEAGFDELVNGGIDTEMRCWKDRDEIRNLIEDWVILRDSGQWARFAELWSPQGRMHATWFQGPASEFISVSREGMEAGISILHFLGGSSITIRGDRAVAQTKMNISQRATVHGVECDVVCVGRFFDFLERLNGRWALTLRQPIYEKDRMDPVRSDQSVTLDPALPSAFPVGYRHLAYLQVGIGQQVKADMPGLTGPVLDALMHQGDAWLDGTATV